MPAGKLRKHQPRKPFVNNSSRSAVETPPNPAADDGALALQDVAQHKRASRSAATPSIHASNATEDTALQTDTSTPVSVHPPRKRKAGAGCCGSRPKRERPPARALPPSAVTVSVHNSSIPGTDAINVRLALDDLRPDVLRQRLASVLRLDEEAMDPLQCLAGDQWHSKTCTHCKP